ncbi:homocysteine S-methyltransferase family protein [Haloferula sp. A504]|uniref:homocysteine S-methyltransferase family protein n=1 Tax=Haloferula sp. A504 TaxID=3373601 RepID=UPI0031C30354|nr:homocysteine S-methyltransferase family protein [Verrucomicrobiaceae bacterium E54]
MLESLLKNHPLILAECAVAERLRRLPGVELHPTLFNTPLIYGPEDARDAMTSIYLEYVETAGHAGLPLLLTAPTWRLDASRIAEAGVPASINTDAVAFLTSLRDHLPPGRVPIAVGALVGPKGDCYRPDLAPDADEAENFHTPQIRELAATPADFLLAQTLPSVDEALGLARAMADTDKPCLISFCTGTDGRVLDGTPLPEAIRRLDDALPRPPAGYFVNCTHPRFLLEAYVPGELDRLVGIQANGSSRDVTALDGAAATEADSVDTWADSMAQLHDRHQVPILGGCCGTSLGHLGALAGIAR